MRPAAASTWLVTGGAGYIGAHTVRALRARGDEVVVLDDLSTGVPDRVREVPLARLSVLDEDAVADVLVEHRVEGVMHLAAKKKVPESIEAPLYYWRENVEGLRSLLSAMVRTGVDRLVYTSSAAVYGATTPAPIREDHACAPVNPYGATKLAGEWMLADQVRAAGLRAVALRYFNVAGTVEEHLADREQTNLVPIALRTVAAGRRPVVFGGDYETADGSCVRDYVHVEDVASAHIAVTGLLAQPGTSTFNVGVGRGYSVRQVLDTVAEVTELPVDPEIVGRRAGDPASVVADVGLIRARVGWAARHDLRSIVASAWAAVGAHSPVSGRVR